MKIIVSDYDGTLNPYYYKPILSKNIEAINNFRNNNNLFIISTGRTFNQIAWELTKYSIPYDYLTCSNGKITYNDLHEIINYCHLNKCEIETILMFLELKFGIDYVKYYNFYENTTFFKPYKIKVTTKKVIDRHLISYLLLNYKVDLLLNKITIRNFANKSKGIILLLKELKLNIEQMQIYTLGNSLNDVKMLQLFNGYKMPWSNPVLMLNNKIPFVSSVHSLIKKI